MDSNGQWPGNYSKPRNIDPVPLKVVKSDLELHLGTTPSGIGYVLYVYQRKISHFYASQAADIWYVDCSYKYKINQGIMVGGKQHMMLSNMMS